MRKSLWAGLVLAVAAGGGYTVMQHPAEVSALLGRAQTMINERTSAAPAKAAVPRERPAGRPAPVEVTRAGMSTARSELHSVGSLSSSESVTLASEVAGIVSEIPFNEGQAVHAGDIVLKLDDALARATLADAQAKLEFAQSNFDRASALSQSGVATQRSRDEAVANLQIARAATELARVHLDKRVLRAPFDGVVGLRSVSIGAFIQAGQPIVNLEKLDVLRLDFRLPEINLADVRTGMAVDLQLDAVPGRTFTARVSAIDPLIDVNGRAIRVRAELRNEDLVLRPGLFARVTLRGVDRGQVVVVPESAIVPRGTEVYVYKIVGGKAVETRVRIGQRHAGEVEIMEGIAAGDTIVTAGQGRVRDGTAVEIVTAAAVR